jgi:hypothetical protein
MFAGHGFSGSQAQIIQPQAQQQDGSGQHPLCIDVKENEGPSRRTVAANRLARVAQVKAAVDKAIPSKNKGCSR